MKNTLLYIQKANEDQATTSCSHFNLQPLSDWFLQQQSQVEFYDLPREIYGVNPVIAIT